MELKLYFLFPFCPPCRLQFNAWVEKRPGHSHRSIKYRPFLVGDDHFRRPRGEVFYRDEIDTFLDIRTEGEGENCRHVISPEHYWVFAQDGCIENMATGGTDSHTKRCALVRNTFFQVACSPLTARGGYYWRTSPNQGQSRTKSGRRDFFKKMMPCLIIIPPLSFQPSKVANRPVDQ